MSLRLACYLLNLLIITQISCKKHKVKPLKCVFVENGIACWYGPGFQGKKTASGAIFNMNLLTAAHRKLEFGTKIRITNLSNQKQVIAEVIDRGPISKKRVLDLSKKAAQEIGLIEAGSANVRIEIAGYKNMTISTLIKHYKNIYQIRRSKIKFKFNIH